MMSSNGGHSTCPPTVALYLGPAYAAALRRYAPVWLWTLRRLAPRYHREAMAWATLFAIGLRAMTLNPWPRTIVIGQEHPHG